MNKKTNIHILISLTLTLLSISIWNLRDFQFSDDSATNINTFVIIIKHFGIDAKELERSITIPLEKRLKGVRGISNIISQTEYEKVRITLEMKSDYNYAESYLDIRDMVFSFYSLLPKSVQKPQIFSGSNRQEPVLIMTINNKTVPRDELLITADEKIRKSIEKIEEAGEVQLGGYQPKEVIIDIDPNMAAALKVDSVSVGSYIKQHYTKSIAGIVQNKDFRWILTSNGRLDFIEEIGDIELTVDNQSTVKLSSIADIYWRYKAPESISRIDNKSQLVFYIKLSGKGSAISLSTKIKELIKSESRNGYTFEVLYDLGDELKDSIKAFIKNIILCMIVVSLFIFIALRKIRSVMLVTLSIPYYALVTISLLHFMNFPVGLSTLLGLGLAIGTVADSGIIILCSSKADRLSKSLKSSLISSALTTVLVTFPLIISSNISINVQKIALSFFIFVLLSTIFNLIILRKIPAYSKVKLNMDFFKRIVLKIINIKPVVVVSISGSVIVAVILAIVIIPKSLGDIHDSETLSIHIEPPSGSKLEYIDNKIKDVGKDILKLTGVESIDSHARKRNGTISIKFNSKVVERSMLLKNLKKLKNNYKDIQIFLPEEQKYSKISISITGANEKSIEDKIESISKILNNKNWLSSIIYNYKQGSPIYTFEVNREVLAMYNVTPKTIFTTLHWALNGPVALKWQNNKEKEKDLRIYINADSYTSIDDIKMIPVKVQNKVIPLSILGNFTTNDNNNTIYRRNLQRSRTFTLLIKSKKIKEIFNNLNNTFNNIKLPAGYSYRLDKSLIESQKETRSLLLFVLVAFFMIYSILVITIDSFITPLLIILTIPLSLALSILTILLLSIPFTTEIFVGCIIVMGIIVNNSILITELFLDIYKKSRDLLQSIIQAIEKRIASIILTTGSTCIGFIPIIAGFGGIQQSISNLAIVIFTGTIGSFIVGIFIYPILLYNLTKLRGNKNESKNS